MDYKDFKYHEITNPERPMRTYQLEDEPELIHIIKTGFKDKYIVVYEDAYELELGKTNIFTKAQLEKVFKITL